MSQMPAAILSLLFVGQLKKKTKAFEFVFLIVCLDCILSLCHVAYCEDNLFQFKLSAYSAELLTRFYYVYAAIVHQKTHFRPILSPCIHKSKYKAHVYANFELRYSARVLFNFTLPCHHTQGAMCIFFG